MSAVREQLHPWAEIEELFRDTLFLGNGASITINENFRYDSLFTTARQSGEVSAEAVRIFEEFDTNDFELVLWRLAQAKRVNEAFSIDSAKLVSAYAQVRRGLLRTVNRIHPSQGDVSAFLDGAANFMTRFKTVICLNYDLICYWATMKANTIYGQNRVKDCWGAQGSRFIKDWKSLRRPYGGHSASTLVFYPHGNLAFIGRPDDEEVKITTGGLDTPLLELIANEWNKNDAWPLFVSEGSSEQKLQSIRRSQYLSEVLDTVIPESKESVAIYGWSMGAADKHILRALIDANPKRIAISFNSVPGRDFQVFAAEKKFQISQMFPNAEIMFFDSSSDGVWTEDSEEDESPF